MSQRPLSTISRMPLKKGWQLSLALLLVLSLVLSACDDSSPSQSQPGPTATTTPQSAIRTPQSWEGDYPPVMPTATVPGAGASFSQPGRYENRDLGITVTYPDN